MGERFYRLLVIVAIALTVTWVGWSLYDGVIREGSPGDSSYLAGTTFFEDARYADALREYREALRTNPDHVHAKRGMARSLMQLGRNEDALLVFDELILQAPDFAASYANRGILNDRMGRYRAAVQDYEKALELDPKLADGPHWMTRFLRNQAERPPTIADRARYLREQLAKPEVDRVLRDPAQDEKQRPYKL